MNYKTDHSRYITGKSMTRLLAFFGVARKRWGREEEGGGLGEGGEVRRRFRSPLLQMF